MPEEESLASEEEVVLFGADPEEFINSLVAESLRAEAEGRATEGTVEVAAPTGVLRAVHTESDTASQPASVLAAEHVQDLLAGPGLQGDRSSLEPPDDIPYLGS